MGRERLEPEGACEDFIQVPLVPRLAFPNREHPPTGPFQSGGTPLVALDVPAEFFVPEFDARLRCRAAGTSDVPVPETSVNEEDKSVTGKDDVRCSREIAAMQTEAQSATVGGAAHDQLGASILPRDTAHERGTLCCRRRVEHAGWWIKV